MLLMANTFFKVWFCHFVSRSCLLLLSICLPVLSKVLYNSSSWSEDSPYPSSSNGSSYFGESSEEGVKEMEYQIQEALLAKIALENDSMLFSMGHQFEEFVFECSFKGYNCR